MVHLDVKIDSPAAFQANHTGAELSRRLNNFICVGICRLVMMMRMMMMMMMMIPTVQLPRLSLCLVPENVFHLHQRERAVMQRLLSGTCTKYEKQEYWKSERHSDKKI